MGGVSSAVTTLDVDFFFDAAVVGYEIGQGVCLEGSWDGWGGLLRDSDGELPCFFKGGVSFRVTYRTHSLQYQYFVLVARLSWVGWGWKRPL